MFFKIYNCLVHYLVSLTAATFFAKLIFESISPDNAETYLLISILFR